MLAKLDYSKKEEITKRLHFRRSIIKEDVKKQLGRVYRIDKSFFDSSKYLVCVKGPTGKFTDLGPFPSHWFIINKYSPMEKYYEVS